MKGRLKFLAMVVAVGSILSGANFAQANNSQCDVDDPCLPTPVTATGTAVLAGAGVAAFGGESSTHWSTELGGIGHSHEWNSNPSATFSYTGNATAGVLKVSFGTNGDTNGDGVEDDASVSLEFDVTSGAILDGSVTAGGGLVIPGGTLGTGFAVVGNNTVTAAAVTIAGVL